MLLDATFGVAPGANTVLAPAVQRFLARVWRQTGIFPAPAGPAATLSIACAPCTVTHGAG